MNGFGVLSDLVRGEKGRELSGVGRAETSPTAGQPTQRSRPKKALEVEDGVKLLPAESSDMRDLSAERAGMIPGLTEELAVEGNDLS